MKVLDIILEDNGQKFYAIGDSHAEGIATYGGKNWISLAVRGTPSTSPVHKAAISKIPKGSTVAVCLGCNDSANEALKRQNGDKTFRSPQQVAQSVKSVVDACTAAGLHVVPVLYPPCTDQAKNKAYNLPYAHQCRDAIKAALPGAIDMDGASLYDGVHATGPAYVKVARQVEGKSSSASPGNTGTANKPVTTKKIGKKEWARNPDGTIKKFDDQGNYITGSELAAIGFGDMDLSGASSDQAPTAGTGSTGTGGGETSSRYEKPSYNKVAAKNAADYLKAKGLPTNHILGILANIAGESGFNSADTTGDHGTSWGLCQWHNSPGSPRRTNMVKFVGSDWKTNWKGQLDFALQEPAGRQYVNHPPFSSPEKAVEWWVYNFEIPADKAGATAGRIKQLRSLKELV
jgi:uncharacterized lipoprotein NlpE involved in copper resistance